MAKRKAFPLRIDPDLYAALQRWAEDELRSVNGQIEFLLRESLLRTSRLGSRPAPSSKGTNASEASEVPGGKRPD